MKHFFCIKTMLGAALLLLAATPAAAFDARMQIALQQQESLNITQATTLALPTLWQRIVPTSHLERVNALKVDANLVLRFQPLQYGANISFNPSQVRAFLVKHGIPMVSAQPHWNLSINIIGFPDLDAQIADDLMDYSQDIASELGFRLSPRGQKLQLTFSPTHDTSGEQLLHLDMQGKFSPTLLSQTAIVAQGYTSYQLQAWLQQILREIRDAYSRGKMDFKEESRLTLLTIEAAHSLSTQVMLEQALSNHPAVLSLTPSLLQQARRQYRLQLRDGDDSWIVSWFSGFGLHASNQVEGSFSDWLVH